MRVLDDVDIHHSAFLRLTHLHRLEPLEGELDWPGVRTADCTEHVHLNVAFEPLEHSLGCVEPCLFLEVEHQNGQVKCLWLGELVQLDSYVFLEDGLAESLVVLAHYRISDWHRDEVSVLDLLSGLTAFVLPTS